MPSSSACSAADERGVRCRPRAHGRQLSAGLHTSRPRGNRPQARRGGREPVVGAGGFAGVEPGTVSHLLSVAGSSLGGPVDQGYLLEAREMQALSFAVHIPLVCFGIAFPAMVLFVEGLHLRTGDPLYLTLAKRWSKVLVTLFAIGVVTGTVLSFELGLLWPAFM